MNFVEELRWRGMIHDVMPGTEELLKKEAIAGYIGFDPTADSLHIGHMVQVMLLVHFQRAGHVPVALIGGATGMIGDPSGKSEERNLLDEPTLRANQEGIKKQLAKFLDFQSDRKNRAIMVNNYDWMKEYSFLGFIRDIGKHITVNYMMAKDSVKKRVGSDAKEGMSFTEFSYQLVQGTDFLHLYKEYGCKLQMGGSDQWGNIVTGTELIRRKTGGEAYALTCPLITKSDGSKFGKTEAGNVWLDPEKTSPYHFYQFWLNVSDEDAAKYIKIFTLLDRKEIENLIKEHIKVPHERILQKRLAEEVTVMVHSREEFESVVEASQILFGKGTTESLKKMNEKTFLSVFESFPIVEISKEVLAQDISIGDLCSTYTNIFTSKAELKRLIQQNGFSLNKGKVNSFEQRFDPKWLLNNKFLVVQKGKKNYTLIKVKETQPYYFQSKILNDFLSTLKNLYLSKGISEFYIRDKKYLQTAYEEVETLWNRQYSNIDSINFIMLSEAPRWGKNKSYIYNPEAIHTQFFYISDLVEILYKPIPDKNALIQELANLGFIVLDIFPYAFDIEKTAVSYDVLTEVEYRELLHRTRPFHLEEKLSLVQRKSAKAKWFYRYNKVRDVLPPNFISKGLSFDTEIPTISQQGGGINRIKLKEIISNKEYPID